MATTEEKYVRPAAPPLCAAKSQAIDLAIAKYRTWRSVVANMPTGDPSFWEASREFEAASKALIDLLKHKSVAYQASDGTLFAYSRIEDSLVITQKARRFKRDGLNHVPHATDDPREEQRQEFVRRATEERETIVAERANRINEGR